ncbi:bifunctional serine/threonine-protein kinase/formylglycine-generating enzyme family protein [Stieleria mannarensis]|uniref:bifunctional serine/threonine-protein kinase/formylglycine-generating enzyme family protein n=1 Tax=Stieleria mannarensis TaxID=2755585 RepID=UPI0015FEE8C0|nr:bifunctional serine/threonine-protein kinase/formylglycine-generating enzyme family protein [Rhodopirellula sp. JC639]
MTDPESETNPRNDARETRTQRTGDDSAFSHGAGGQPIDETINASSVTNPDNRPDDPEDVLPRTIGRYKIESLLGKGGFGSVYLAYDDELQRHVTIKVPHRHRVKRSKDVNAFLTEARTLAKLEHPNVVPVHDVGTTDDGLCFIVSRYIDGSDLVRRLQSTPLSIFESVELVATIAEALHYVHNQGVIHRDIKPNNILLDKRGTAYVADFGLALLEDDGIGSKTVAGTPAYMSPEQARGENHLVKRTSDIFSLGVVLYQLLTGQRPFVAEPGQTVTDLIQEQEVRPPRDLNRDVPTELERICMKTLSKRATARYQTALEMCEDLRHLLSDGQNLALVDRAIPTDPKASKARKGDSDSSRSGSRRLGIVPKGLRSFGPQDAHFFLGLLPGPYDRDGTPESILFWKRRIEESDPENSFRIGLIYGPSGCGKSSFVKAGLVPTLSADIVPVVIEAAPDATETRLLNRLRRRCPYLDTDLGLPESIATLRRGEVMGRDKKILIVIDQFEQWLYSIDRPEHSVLAKALRQCDGEHVQCILMVRDDFWLAFSRFMDHLEVDLMQNKNMALIDLFDLQHARRVLTEFGRAFDRLPEHRSDFSRDQRAFVTQAIEGLAEHGKVTPVRLALFAEMIKSKPWTTATLRKIGGTAGVGLMFLDENFSSENAPANYRVHLRAVYETLGALLPQPGANLKGHMRSREELLEVSGYADQPKQFQSMMRALDSELHLIVRTDPEGRGDVSQSQSGVQSASQSGSVTGNLSQLVYYHLAHDYLVPAIRDWQAHMQRGTRTGRAEIRLAQRTEVWNVRPDKRHLPTLPEWGSILALTRREHWDDAQRRMMRSATRRHVSNLTLAAFFLLLGGWGAYELASWNRAETLTDQLTVAKVGEVSGLLDQLERRERWALDNLVQIQQQSRPGSPPHLFSSLALLRSGRDELAEIKPALLHSDPETLELLCRELDRFGDQLSEYLWNRAEDETLLPRSDENGRVVSPRFNAALALATFDPPDQTSASGERWKALADEFADELIHFANIDRRYFRSMVNLIRPTRPVLVEPLAAVMTSDSSDETEIRRSAAQNLLINLLEDDVPELTNQLLHAEVQQILFSIDLIDKHRDAVRPLLDRAVAKSLDVHDPNWKRDAKRKASAAAILLRHGASNADIWATFRPDQQPPRDPKPSADTNDWVREELRRLLAEREFAELESADREQLVSRYRQISFGRTSIPNARTRLVQRIGVFGVDPEPIAQRLLVEPDVATQCGLIQALGEFPPEQINADLRNRVVTLIQGWFATASHASLRANSLWFLGQWNQSDWVGSQLYLAKPQRPSDRNWYVSHEGHTMILLPLHAPDATYRIEAAMAEVTLGQMLRWIPDGEESKGWKSASEKAAAGSVTYHDAVAYCNWLTLAEGMDEDELCYTDRSDNSIEPARLHPDYRQRKGYRLPMAEEWFFMCNGGAITDYSFGSCAQPSYLLSTDRISAGYTPSKPTDGKTPWAVGLARPNGFGIFDAYSNVREWTNDIDPVNEARLQVCGFDFRFHMGMSGIQPRYLGWSQPHSQPSFYGFRVFRSRPVE